ncbi:DUF397 domain-containing protein [Streptomyces sp. CG1]|uniref:DUF397 domain-containing protein n=1 Tax=Streptomyces sp. CG1 TaxID=1287523 RepID=UPI0034E1EA37
MNNPRPSSPAATAKHDVDLTRARWWKSSYSGGANDCVEVADVGAYVAVRDSKRVELLPLVFGRNAMGAFVADLAAGDA